MKTKKVIFHDDGYVLFVDSQDEKLIYASSKEDFQKAMTLKSKYSNSEEIPENLIIKILRLNIVTDSSDEEIYDAIDKTLYDLPLKRIKLQAFKIDYKNTNGPRSL